MRPIFIRHAITKMSSPHFVTNELQQRLRQMGESPEHAVISPGIDQMIAMPRMDRAGILKVLLKPQEYNFLVTLHPETPACKNDAIINAVLPALETYPDVGLIFTVRTLTRAGELDEIIRSWVVERDKACSIITRVIRYFSAPEHCDWVLGNSSSGFTRPSFSTPSQYRRSAA